MGDLTLKDLWYNPDFQELSYRAQQRVRATVATEELGRNAEFMKLPPEAKTRVLQEIIYAPPAFSNKKLEQAVATIGKRAEAGDPKAFDEMRSSLAWRENRQTGILTGLFGKLSERIFSHGVIDEAAMNTRARNVQPLLTANFPNEEEKILEYYASVSDKRGGMKRQWALTKLMAPLVMPLLETLPLYAMGAGTTWAPRGVGKLVMGGFNRISAGLKTRGLVGLTALGGEVAHGAVTAGIWTAHEMVKDLINDDLPKDPGLQDTIEYGMKRFAEGFVFDVIANVATGIVLPMLKTYGRTFKGFAKDPRRIFQGLEQEQISQLTKNILNGGFIPAEQLRQLPEPIQDLIQATISGRKVFDNVPKLNPEDLFQAASLSLGWTPKKLEGEKWLLHSITEGTEKTVKDLRSGIKFLTQEWRKVGGVPLTPRDAILSGGAYNKARLRKTITAQLPDSAFENVDILARLAAPKGNHWTQGRVRAFGKATLRAMGAEENVIRNLETRELGQEIILQLQEGGAKPKQLVGSIPKTITSAKQEERVIGSIIDALKPYGGENINIADDLLKEYRRSLVRQNLFTPAWVEDTITNKLKGSIQSVEGGFEVTLPNSGKIFFEDVDQMGKFIISESIEPETFQQALKEHMGLNLRINKEDGTAAILHEGRVVASAEDFRSLVRQNPDFIEKIPASLGPQLTLVDENTLRVKYSKGVVIAPYQKLLQHLDHFQGPKVKGRRVRLYTGKGGSIQVDEARKSFELYMPDIEFRSPVKSFEEAKKFLREGITKWKNLELVSHNKGYRVTPWGDGYAFYSTVNDGEVHIARNIEEAKKILSEVPMPNWAPELSGIPRLVDIYKSPEGVIPTNIFKPTEFTPKHESLRAWTKISHAWRPVDAWLPKAIEQGGDVNVLEGFRSVESTRRFIRGEEEKGRTAILAIFTERQPSGRLGKKLIPLEERIRVGEYLHQKRVQTVQAQRLAEEMYGNFNERQKNLVNRIREEFFGATPEAGVAYRFGIESEAFLTDYMPRIRLEYMKNPQRSYAGGEVRSFLRDVYGGGKPPAELDAFFKHQSVNDILRMAVEVDPLKVMLQYQGIGLRERYLGPVWKRLDQYLRANGKKMDRTLRSVIELYRRQVMGLPESFTQEALQDSIEAAFAKQGVGATRSRDIARLFASGAYFSFMGFRAMLPIRNVHQIWTTLAFRVGNDWTVKGLKAVADDTSGTIYQALRERGNLLTQLPLFGGEVLEKAGGGRLENFFKKLVHTGLRFYKNSDDFTRAVAYTASRMRFDDAVSRLRRGVWKDLPEEKQLQAFMKMSGANQLDFDIQEEIKAMMRTRTVEAAADRFASQMTEETMFAYRSGMNPTTFRGTVGTMFGMFGHYPSYYVENIKRGLKNMSWGERAAAIGRWLGNSAALYFVFKEGLGINMQAFLPWQPMFFSGGPLYHMMNQALFFTDTRSYKGRQARAELLGLSTREGKLQWQPGKSELGRLLVPYQVRSIGKAVEAFNEGDVYRGLLNMGSFPINPDWWGFQD